MNNLHIRKVNILIRVKQNTKKISVIEQRNATCHVGNTVKTIADRRQRVTCSRITLYIYYYCKFERIIVLKSLNLQYMLQIFT